MSATVPPLAASSAARPTSRLGLVITCLAATWFIWGSTYLAIKWALVSFPPFLQMGTRFLAAAAALGAFAAWRGSRWPSKAQWLSAWVLGALMIGGGYGATAYSQTSLSSGLVVAFIAVTPVLVSLFQWPYGVRPLTTQLAGKSDRHGHRATCLSSSRRRSPVTQRCPDAKPASVSRGSRSTARKNALALRLESKLKGPRRNGTMPGFVPGSWRAG